MDKRLTRRHALQIAAAGAVAAPFAITPTDAARALDGPAPAPVTLTPTTPAGGMWDVWSGGTTVYDPVGFAEELLFDDDWSELLSHIAPAETAAYVQARAAVYRALPILRDVPFDHPWVTMDEAYEAVKGAAYAEGLRQGAAVEHLRLALVGSTRTCRACRGIGRLGEEDAGAGALCAACQGAGTVPTPAPSLAG